MGELLPQRRRDTGDLELRSQRQPPGRGLPADAERCREVVGQDPVVELGHGHGGLEQAAGIEGPPAAVRCLDPVDHRDVGVQLRVAGARVPVIEGCRDHPADVFLHHAALAGAGGEHLPFGVVDHEPQRLHVRGVDRGLGLRVGQGPHHRHALGHAERQIEPGHRTPTGGACAS